MAVLACADVLDILGRVNIEGRTLVEPLRLAIRSFLKLCIQAGWKDWMVPKFHWMVHLPRHLAKFELYVRPAGSLSENMAKRYIKNLRRYDRTLIGEIVCHNLAFLEEDDVFDISVGLKKPCKLSKQIRDFVQKEFRGADLENCFSGHEARLEHGSCCRGDVVLIRSVDGTNYVGGKVWLHLSIAGSPQTLIEQ